MLPVGTGLWVSITFFFFFQYNCSFAAHKRWYQRKHKITNNKIIQRNMPFLLFLFCGKNKDSRKEVPSLLPLSISHIFQQLGNENVFKLPCTRYLSSLKKETSLSVITGGSARQIPSICFWVRVIYDSLKLQVKPRFNFFLCLNILMELTWFLDDYPCDFCPHIQP